MTGLIVLLIALAACAVAAPLYVRRNGRFATQETAVRETDDRPIVDVVSLGAEPGSTATLLQFSSAFCAPCRATRRVLGDVADVTPGVTHVEVDAESHLDLVRELDVRRTPTTLVLDADGRVRTRASGQPQREQVLAALASVVDADRA